MPSDPPPPTQPPTPWHSLPCPPTHPPSHSPPPPHQQILGEYTREGLRVIALAAGSIPPGSLPGSALHDYNQTQLEGAVPLSLVGLAVLANPLRPDTAGVIGTLQKAQVGGGGRVGAVTEVWHMAGGKGERAHR
jgi:hypothetical protein